ncbi:hypothetical protein FV223_29525, partial [Methylobacterium sp. WL116]
MTYPPHPAVTRDTILCEGRPVTIERFAPRGKDAPATTTVILLHDAEGPGPDRPVRAEAAALAEAGFAVLLPHYLERTGEARVGFSGISRHFGAWRDALEIVRAQVPGPAARSFQQAQNMEPTGSLTIPLVYGLGLEQDII